MVDTLLLKEEDGGVLGLDRCIGIAIAGDPKRLRHASFLYGEMLGEKRVLEGIMMEKVDGCSKSTFFKNRRYGYRDSAFRFFS